MRTAREQELLRVAHGEEDLKVFCQKVGIESVRNLEIYLRKSGIFDGREWSHGDIAAAYGISRPRSVQICIRTECLVKTYFANGERNAN